MKTITITEFRRLLRDACKEAGSQSAMAAKLGVSRMFLNDVLQGRCKPSQRILKAMGHEKTVVYRKVMEHPYVQSGREVE